MKTIILPFSCIKAHYEGDIFLPVEVAAGVWELQSATRVLGGSNGNLYHSPVQPMPRFGWIVT